MEQRGGWEEEGRGRKNEKAEKARGAGNEETTQKDACEDLE